MAMDSGRGKLGQTVKAEAHGADADEAAPEMTEGLVRLECHCHLPLPGDEGDDRKDREEGAEKHQLTRRNTVRCFQQARHADKDADRSDLETNSQHDIGAAHTICNKWFTVSRVNNGRHGEIP